MRLIIDARMLDHSGIGVYLSNILPSVLQRCAELRPVLLAMPKQQERARMLCGSLAEVVPWAVAPLTAAELRPPPVVALGDICRLFHWWSRCTTCCR